jgi:hypothetical protein
MIVIMKPKIEKRKLNAYLADAYGKERGLLIPTLAMEKDHCWSAIGSNRETVVAIGRKSPEPIVLYYFNTKLYM